MLRTCPPATEVLTGAEIGEKLLEIAFGIAGFTLGKNGPRIGFWAISLFWRFFLAVFPGRPSRVLLFYQLRAAGPNTSAQITGGGIFANLQVALLRRRWGNGARRKNGVGWIFNRILPGVSPVGVRLVPLKTHYFKRFRPDFNGIVRNLV